MLNLLFAFYICLIPMLMVWGLGVNVRLNFVNKIKSALYERSVQKRPVARLKVEMNIQRRAQKLERLASIRQMETNLTSEHRNGTAHKDTSEHRNGTAHKEMAEHRNTTAHKTIETPKVEYYDLGDLKSKKRLYFPGCDLALITEESGKSSVRTERFVG